MKTMEELRHQIGNVEDVKSIVGTMKTMAAVHIRQYESAADSMLEYLRTVELGFQILLRDRQVLNANSQSRSAGAIIFGSDQGLCGKFNEDIARFALSDMQASSEIDDWRLIVAGIRAAQFITPMPPGFVTETGPVNDQLRTKQQSRAVEKVLRIPTMVADITTLLQELMPYVEKWRSDGVCRIDLYFNSRTSAATYQSEKFQLFPISSQFLKQCKTQPWTSRGLPTYSMSWNDLFASVVRQYLFVGLYRATAESRASENASRIAAMQTASKNVDRRLYDLRKEFNETRQTAITEEILDITTGVEAQSRR